MMSFGPQIAKATLSKPTTELLVFEDANENPMAAAILQAMSDATSRAILNSVVAAGRSIEEIAETMEIPVSTTYRRVHELAENGLMVVERIMVGTTGKRSAIYRSTLRGARIDVEYDKVRVVGLPNELLPDVMFRLWQFAESRRVLRGREVKPPQT